MINGANPSVAKSSFRQALEDAIIIGLLALVGGLIAAGNHWPPEGETLYGAGLAALLGGILAWARARQIQRA